MRGAKPERWVRQTNFDNDEAVGYLADRLARLGVEEALAEAGAEPGCPGDHRRRHVRLGAHAPRPGSRSLMSGRGTDRRLEQNDRVGADERKAARAAPPSAPQRRRARAEAASSRPRAPRVARATWDDVELRGCGRADRARGARPQLAAARRRRGQGRVVVADQR